MADKGRALKPQGGSDAKRHTVERSSRRRDSKPQGGSDKECQMVEQSGCMEDLKPDLSRIDGIFKRDRGKATARSLDLRDGESPPGRPRRM